MNEGFLSTTGITCVYTFLYAFMTIKKTMNIGYNRCMGLEHLVIELSIYTFLYYLTCSNKHKELCFMTTLMMYTDYLKTHNYQKM